MDRNRPADTVTNSNTDHDLRIGALTERFLDHCRIAKGLSTHTLRAYGFDLAHFASAIGSDTRVTAIGRDTVREYARGVVDNRQLAASSLKRRIATLKVMFRWLEREELLEASPFHRLDLSIRLPKRLPRSLTPHEMRQLIRTAEAAVRAAHASSRYPAILLHFAVVALFTTGLRVSELVSAKLQDVSLLEGAIQVRGKGNRERTVYLPGRQASTALARYYSARKAIETAEERLLASSDGKGLTPQDVRKHLRTLAITAGIERRVTPHMLRHTAATQLLEAGVDIRFVQRLLGHASISTTQIYTQVRDSTLKAKLVRANTLARLNRAAG
jgi:site-specific recombinase XerD